MRALQALKSKPEGWELWSTQELIDWYANQTQPVAQTEPSGPPQTSTSPGQPEKASRDNQEELGHLLYYKFFEYPEDNKTLLALMVKDAAKVLETHSYEQAKDALSYAKKTRWWLDKFLAPDMNRPMLFLAKTIDSILGQSEANKNRPVSGVKLPDEAKKDLLTNPEVVAAMKWIKKEN